MTIARRTTGANHASAAGASTTGYTGSFTLDSAPAEGNLMTLWGQVFNGQAADGTTISAPSGWSTGIVHYDVSNTSNTGRGVALFWKIAGASESVTQPYPVFANHTAGQTNKYCVGYVEYTSTEGWSADPSAAGVSGGIALTGELNEFSFGTTGTLSGDATNNELIMYFLAGDDDPDVTGYWWSSANNALGRIVGGFGTDVFNNLGDLIVSASAPVTETYQRRATGTDRYLGAYVSFVEGAGGAPTTLENIRQGAATPTIIYAGSSEVTKIYQGANQLWGDT